MNRRQPSPLASWALGHLTSGDQDEAIAGDLLEHFRAGRSGAWYWRQVVASCLLSWSQSLTARGPALVFVLGWSVLAPAWKAALDRIADPLSFERAWQTFGLLWLPIGLIGWTALHAAFLWIGLLVYQFAHTFAGHPLPRRDLSRAFWIATLAYPPIAGLTYLLAGIYVYSMPGLAHATLASNALGQIADLGILPDLIRVPYLVAFLIALWPIAYRQRRGQREAQPYAPSTGSEATVLSGTIALTSRQRPANAGRFIGYMAGVGLINALIAGIIVCRLPNETSPSLASVLIHAAGYVAVGVAGGIMGTYIYWLSPWTATRQQPPIPFPLLAIVCASGWVWIPSMILFGDSLSAGAAIVATIATYALVSGLRRASYFISVPAAAGPAHAAPGEARMFEESLYRPPADLAGYAIALSLYAAGASLAVHSNYGAAGLLAVGAALFAWRRTLPREHFLERGRQYASAAVRVAIVIIPAILITAWALLDGVSYRNRTAAAGSNSSPLSTSKIGIHKPRVVTVAYNVGYESVILWPPPQKKQIVAPVSAPFALFGSDNKRPLIIRFDGPYTYVQPPEKSPGPNAHQAHGTPLDANIHSANALPVVMQAHQNLLTSVPVAQCREIDVQIENYDNLAGRISLALLLTSDSPHGPTIYAGQQPIASTEPEHFDVKAEPVRETLHFAVTESRLGEKFTGITVMLLPDVEHKFIAPRIALEQFEILPR